MVSLFGKYLTYAMLGAGARPRLGLCGILSLGHGAFFALGGYAMGMYLMRQIGDRGVYANPNLPDFMVFLNWKELPWYWWGFDMFWFADADGDGGAGPARLRLRLVRLPLARHGVYLSIITQAMTFALLLAFFRNDMGFGGNNGLTDFKDILGFNIQYERPRARPCSPLTAIALAGALIITLGHHAVEARQGDRRRCAMRKAGRASSATGRAHVKLFAFVVSAVMAGIAGALYVPQVGIINPGEFAPANSIEVVVWTAIGGRGTLIGPIIGAILVNWGKTMVHRARFRNSGCSRWAACSFA
jgi:urea transport system permease protein